MRADALLPVAGPGPGTPLWGAPPRKQPIVPLIALAFLTVLICAPAAMSSGGRSSNPLTLMRETASATYKMAGMVDETNATLTKIDENTKPLGELAVNMDGISTATNGMDQKTQQLSRDLGTVGESVGEAKGQLKTVDGKLDATATAMDAKHAKVRGSLKSTKQIVGEFKQIDRDIGSMRTDLTTLIALMAESTPQTRAFAQNQTRLSVAGGDGTKYEVPNFVPGTRVMTVMLNMLGTMQKGGPLPARKDRAVASNPLIGTVLGKQVPDGTNVIAHVKPYDGRYGLPNPDYFVSTPVNGF